MCCPFPIPSDLNVEPTMPEIESIFQKSFPLTSKKKIAIDFDTKTIFPFMIKDYNESDDPKNLKTLTLTRKTLTTLISHMEDYILTSSMDDTYALPNQTIPIGGDKAFILTQCMTISSKEYLDSRLWMRLNSTEEIPTKRGFRCEMKDIPKVLESLSKAKKLFEHYRFKIAKIINDSVHTFALLLDEKIRAPSQYHMCLTLGEISWKNLTMEEKTFIEVKEFFLNSFHYSDFEEKFKSNYETSPDIDLASVFQYIKTNDEVGYIKL